jgi:hypothetical protein
MKTEYRGFIIQSIPSLPNLFEIKFNGSGRLADALQGNFTTPLLARSRIDMYVEGVLPKKAVKNEADSKG